MKSAEEMERLVQQVSFKANSELAASLRAHVVQAYGVCAPIESGPNEKSMRRRIMRIPTIRIAIAALIGTGVVTATVVGVRYKYHFASMDEGGRQIVEREDGLKTWHLSQQTAPNPEQAVQTAEELDLLGQQGRRELVLVGEWEVNGQLDQRSLTYDYHLADGRTVRAGEPDPDNNAPKTLTGERLQEAVRLARQTVASTGSVGQFQMTEKRTVELPRKGTPIPTYERVIQGRTFRFEKYTFTLSDGTPVTYSLGTLKESQ